jgi:hypothetical protein
MDRRSHAIVKRSRVTTNYRSGVAIDRARDFKCPQSWPAVDVAEFI